MTWYIFENSLIFILMLATVCSDFIFTSLAIQNFNVLLTILLSYHQKKIVDFNFVIIFCCCGESARHHHVTFFHKKIKRVTSVIISGLYCLNLISEKLKLQHLYNLNIVINILLLKFYYFILNETLQVLY